MSAFLIVAACVLLALFVASLWRIHEGPGEADRMLSVQLLGTTTVGILLLLSAALDQPILLAIALLFVLLAGVVAIAFVRSAPAQRGRR